MQKNKKTAKKLLTNAASRGTISKRLRMRLRYARVVELVDSLDSGSSAHSGHAGSSPASRTKRDSCKAVSFFVSTSCLKQVNPLGIHEFGTQGVFFVSFCTDRSICNYLHPFRSPSPSIRRPPTKMVLFTFLLQNLVCLVIIYVVLKDQLRKDICYRRIGVMANVNRKMSKTNVH